MRALSGLEPKNVFGFFEDICKIPHGSGNTELISKYCVEFAQKHGLFFHKDSMNNVIIRKPASQGYEAHPTVILQAHLDMVCEKLPRCGMNFETDALRLATDGDYIFAENTTLGGDDGIGVAMILAILADKHAVHPELEAVFTVDEETGMYGAQALDASLLKGRMLINIDSEEMGVLTVGCAGGARADLTLPLKRTQSSSPCFEITVSGLAGGHSGMEIDKGRLNANKVMGDFLRSVYADVNIVSVEGGSKDNAIPRECRCIVCTDADIAHTAAEFAQKNRVPGDPGLTVSVKPVGGFKTCCDSDTTEKIIELICELPFGVIKMSDDISGLVQTSVNFGILKSGEDSLCASFSVRSSVESEKEQQLAVLCKIITKYGGSFKSRGNYPAWEYRKNSRLRDIMASAYSDMFGISPKIEAIHAGLECGLFAEKIADFDAVSIGPDMYDVHTARERLSISSTGKVYDYLRQVLMLL